MEKLKIGSTEFNLIPMGISEKREVEKFYH